ncbi:MAG: ABC transporter ATP-binding protein [Planctomycetota bacterium]|jgi:ABC-2 type transport system ATP-binding protein
MAHVLEIKNLTKRFGKVTAVDNLSLAVEEGDIFGFLGPNGAGKTTTMACCVNLIRKTNGEIKIFGKPVRRDFLEIFRSVGCLVEAPAYYPYLSGRANLEVLARCGGKLDRKEINGLIDLVGMTDSADRKFRTYSTGMKARLALAGVLIGSPKLVILDEPTSGLDPAGVELVREIVRGRNEKDGVSFFISSHNLDEVERMCNRVALIDRGRLAALGDVKKLLTPQVDGFLIDCDRPEEAAAALSEMSFITEAAVRDGGEGARVEVRMKERRPEEAARMLVERSFSVRALVPVRLSLEEFFHRKLGRKEPGKNLDRPGSEM